jgi:murein DD-endopeptidase MepM/ murein hydrolase activator NlpD
VWRVANLKVDGNMEVVEGTFGKHGFVQSLAHAGIPRTEIKRLAHALESVHRATRPAATDTFVLARDKSKNTIVAFELAMSPVDVWQVRLDDPDGKDEGRTTARKLDLFIEHKHAGGALVVGADLGKAALAAGLRPETVDAISDAVEGHVEPGTVRAGLRMRVATTEDWVEGALARVRVDAIELVPPKGAPFRVYHYERDPSAEGSHRHAPAAGFYDAKGRQPVHGAFRSPIPLARVTSRFNPKRMHPVLHVVMPHNGIDFGATTGTPVYAAAAGTVISAANSGPCGNMVEIEHTGGTSTAYCHLNGFAQGLHSGQKVEAHQLVGYVGHTGRVTGPHLHFAAKKNGVFIDPQGLKMDGMRVLPPSDREAFAKNRGELDAVLDGIALPAAPNVPDVAEPEAEGTDDDKDFHEE